MINNTNNKLLKPVLAAILAALALIVGYLEIVWPMAPWLKLDFSEVVILISFVLIGFNHTLAVIVIRSVVRWLISGHSTNIPFPFFGETVAIIASIVMILIYMGFSRVLRINNYRYDRPNSVYEGNKSLVSGIGREIALILIVTVLMALFMVTINYLVVTPSFASSGEYPFFISLVNSGKYDRMFGGPGIMNYTIFIVSLYGPFNLVKFASCMILFTLIRRPILIAINSEE